ncbi:MAG: dicarboxylate/amino acid:cation symporter [Turneriella sp.]|nr:dicarboxylate/amino acid:cation symporter [Turneriella sp.]
MKDKNTPAKDPLPDAALPSMFEQLRYLLEKKLWAQVIAGLLLGLVVGALLNVFSAHFSEPFLKHIGIWLAFPGKQFMKLVQMVMVALIVTSIISGVGGSTGSQLRSVGIKSLVYFVFTTIVAVTLGLTVSYFIPLSGEGKPVLGMPEVAAPALAGKPGNLPDLILSLIPENPIQAMLNGEMLNIVVFSIIVGIAITQLKKEASTPLMSLIQAVQDICMNIVKWVMLLVPYAVFGIMAGIITATGFKALAGLLFYFLAVLTGLALILVFYLLVVKFLGRQNPIAFLRNIADSMLLAFSTTSSAAVMPLSMKIATEKLHVRPEISNFVIPLGTTINMDGTALFRTVSFLFVAQMYGITLSFPNLILSLLTIIMASIGTPAVPGAGIIVLASVFKSAGIPAEAIMTIIGFERILGMFRSAINVTGDLTACTVFDRLTKSR